MTSEGWDDIARPPYLFQPSSTLWVSLELVTINKPKKIVPRHLGTFARRVDFRVPPPKTLYVLIII